MFKIKPNPAKKINGELLKIFDPVRKDFLPMEGRVVPGTDYWVRMLQNGSVIKTAIEETAEDKTKKSKVKTGEKE